MPGLLTSVVNFSPLEHRTLTDTSGMMMNDDDAPRPSSVFPLCLATFVAEQRRLFRWGEKHWTFVDYPDPRGSAALRQRC